MTEGIDSENVAIQVKRKTEKKTPLGLALRNLSFPRRMKSVGITLFFFLVLLFLFSGKKVRPEKCKPKAKIFRWSTLLQWLERKAHPRLNLLLPLDAVLSAHVGTEGGGDLRKNGAKHRFLENQQNKVIKSPKDEVP